jgi:hypothetical protein
VNPSARYARLGDLTAFQDHVIDRAVSEAAAHGQTGVTGANYYCGDGVDQSRSSLS